MEQKKSKKNKSQKKQNKFISAMSQKYNNFLAKDFNLVKNFKYTILAPVVILLVAVIMFACLGFNLALDFTGGTILKVNFGTDISNTEYNAYKTTLEKVLKDNGITKYTLQKEGSTTDASVSVKFQDVSGKTEAQMNDLVETVKKEISEQINPNNEISNFSVEDGQRIGASASSSLLTNALLAVSIAIVLMLIYIAIRFEFASGVSAIIALLHDVLLMCAFVVICRIQINSSFIAALITIIGYSINNTIVIFDRVRENLRRESYQAKTNSEIVDISVKDTLTRTFYTSITTIVSVLLLAIIGVSAIREFLLPILFGLVAGTYSSVFISGPIWSFIYKKDKDKRLKKRIEQDKKDKKNPIPEDKIVV